MQILLPLEIKKRLTAELKRAGRREIGGLLLGEHIGGDTFKIVEITVQTELGTASHFERDPAAHQKQLDDFFARTRNNCSRFNYFGEWHSHPSFVPVPSSTDIQSMDSILNDSTVGVNFLVLLIVQLVQRDSLAMSATVCKRDTHPISSTIFIETELTQVVARRRIRTL